MISAPIVAALFAVALINVGCSRTTDDHAKSRSVEPTAKSKEPKAISSEISKANGPSPPTPAEATQKTSESIATAVTARDPKRPIDSTVQPGDQKSLEPTDRLWLPTSLGPVIIDLVIQIDGQSLDHHFEEQIERVIKAAASTKATWEQLFEHIASDPAKFGSTIAVNRQNSRDMKRRFDRNRNGLADFAEAARYLFHRTPSAAPFRLSGTDAFASATAADSPMFKQLDSNADGFVSDEELTTATASLAYFDDDLDERIDVDEVVVDESVSTDAWQTKRSRRWATVAMDFRDPIDWTMVGYSISGLDRSGPFRRSADFLNAIDQDHNQSITDTEAERLKTIAADAQIHVDYQGRAAPRMAVTETGSHVGNLRIEPSPGKLVIGTKNFQLVLRAGAPIQATFWDCQVRARGAEVADPMLAFLDTNSDQCMSTREIVNAESRLRSIASGGSVSADDLPVSYQIRFVRGNPSMDDQLYGMQSTRRDVSDSRPPWAIAMDRNRDGDISQTEFLGNASQFHSIDANGDGFLDASELATALP